MRVAELEPKDDDDDDRSMTCAFCFRTSAGVRIRQDTSSPLQEAIELINGVGSWRESESWLFSRIREALEASYVVKKAPASNEGQCGSLQFELLLGSCPSTCDQAASEQAIRPA